MFLIYFVYNLGADILQICWRFRFILQASFRIQYALQWLNQIDDGILWSIYLRIWQCVYNRFNGSDIQYIDWTGLHWRRMRHLTERPSDFKIAKRFFLEMNQKLISLRFLAINFQYVLFFC